MDQNPYRDEKLPLHDGADVESARQTRCRGSKGIKAVKSLLLVAALFVFVWPQSLTSLVPQTHIDDALVRWVHASSESSSNNVCPQVEPWAGPGEGAPDVAYPDADAMGQRLSGAVKIDTTVHDDEPPPEEDDERWQRRFQPLRDFFESTFPKTHDDNGPVKRELVHGHGLLYTWPGSDASLKPLLLMAHQDVVPVDQETLSEWLVPPFDGAIINETVIGRGAADIKSLVVSILSAVEGLVEAGFEPQRTLLVSFGYDEEVSGKYGGQYLAKRIEELHGKDSIAMVVDEGNPVVSKYDAAGVGLDVAMPGVEEKGQAQIRIRIEGQGGHSSQPPPRTTIGLLGEFLGSIDRVDGDNLKEPVIPDLDSAYLKMLQCVRDGPIVPSSVRQALKHLDWASRSSVTELSVAAADQGSIVRFWTVRAFAHLLDARKRQRIDRAKRALLASLPDKLRGPWRTTQTPTVFHAGIKRNAIPPSATVEIDHRIALHHSVQYVKDWYLDRLTRFAKKHNLDLVAYGEEQAVLSGGGDNKNPTAPSAGKIILDVTTPPLAPAPRTPTDHKDPAAAPWRLLSSVIRSTWATPAPGSADGKPILVSPAQMTGNTDTRWMWRLSPHIFRFMPASLLPDPLPAHSAFAGVHGVNEHFRVDGLERAVRFYTGLVMAVQGQRGDGWEKRD